MSKSTTRREKSWFIDREDVVFLGRGETTIAHDPRRDGNPGAVPQVPQGAGRAAPRPEAARQARPLRRGPADDAARLLGPGGGARPRPEVLVAWLRRILARTLADAVKHYERDKRDVALERSLEADLDRSASGFAAWLAADQTSPSGRAERNEELLRMVEALAELPELMREVVVLEALPGLDAPADRRADRP